MARKKLLNSIHPGEILLEEFMKPLASASTSTGSRARSASEPSSRVLFACIPHTSGITHVSLICHSNEARFVSQ